MNYTILFPDGSRVSAGSAGAAVRTLQITSGAFSSQEPIPGGVFASELSAELFDDGLALTAGDTLQVYENERLIGTFTAEKPERPRQGLRKILAYDHVSRLDKDLTHWLSGLTDWPYTLSELAQMVCAACGVTLTGSLVNGERQVSRFQARGITGRQLMQWVCQAGCRFLTALPDGTLRLGWAEDSGITLKSTGEAFYFQGLTYSDYATLPIDGVQFALTGSDVGVATEPSAQNPLKIQGNYLLSGWDSTAAHEILDGLSGLSVTPCTLETTTVLAPGQLFTVETEEGSFTALAMTVTDTLGRYRVQCTGSPSLSSASAICRGDYRALSGRVLELQLELQGVHSRMAEFSEDSAKVSSLSQNVDAITARVGVLATGEEALGKSLAELEETAQGQFSQLSLRSDALELSVSGVAKGLEEKADGEVVQQLTQRFRFDEEGLTISNTATGMGISVSEQQVAFSEGTRITPTRLQTTDLQVESRLHVGGFAFLPRTGGNLSLRYVGQYGKESL